MRKQIKLSISHKSGNTTVSRTGVVEIEKEGGMARFTRDTFESNMYHMDDEELTFIVTVFHSPLVRAMVTVNAGMTDVLDVCIADFSTITDKGEIRCEPADNYKAEIKELSAISR